MKWSWGMGRIAGIELRVHATFLILLAWIALREYQRSGAYGALLAVGFILALFASVVLHEFGHALTARRFGVPTRNITLLPIGGVAQLERMPEKPAQELLVALAGPAVTVGLVILLWAVLVVMGQPLRPSAAWGSGAFISELLWANALLAVFNLLPAFPMDGGRVLRAGLATRMDYARATDIAAKVGKGFALLFAVYGLYRFDENPLLVFIALFVWMGAAAEANSAQLRSVFGGLTVASAMIREIHVLSPLDPLDHAIDYMLEGFQQDFPVVDGGVVVGVLTRGDLLKALAHRDRSTSAAEAMSRQFETAAPAEPLESAFRRLQSCRCHTMPVIEFGRLVGVLTMDNVSELLMIESALGRRREEGSGAA